MIQNNSFEYPLRRHSLVNIDTMNYDISLITLRISKIKKRIIEIEKDIQISHNISDIPRDTSLLNDEHLIRFVEERNSLFEELRKLESKLESIKDDIANTEDTINKLPNGTLKSILYMSFVECMNAKEIGNKLGCSRQFVYKTTAELHKSLY